VLPATGQYSIVVDPGEGATGDAELLLTSATEQQGTAIGVDGPAVKATIAQAGAIASFTFDGTAGQKVYLEVRSSSLPDECGVLKLHAPDNLVIAGGCIIAGGGSIDGTVLPATGQYSIVVDPGEDATGDAELLLHT